MRADGDAHQTRPWRSPAHRYGALCTSSADWAIRQASLASKPTGQFMALQRAATAAEHDLSIDRHARRDLDLAYEWGPGPWPLSS